ncbi:hypothetical protein GEMRC1_013231 [Eukaryota sp. GEM-RC1]
MLYLRGAQKKLTRIFFSDRAEIFASSLPSNLLSVHNACQLPFLVVFFLLFLLVETLLFKTPPSDGFAVIVFFVVRTLFLVIFALFLRLMLVTAQIVTTVLVIVLLDMTRSRNLITEHTSFAVEFKLKLGAAYGVIDLFDPHLNSGLDVAVVRGMVIS